MNVKNIITHLCTPGLKTLMAVLSIALAMINLTAVAQESCGTMPYKQALVAETPELSAVYEEQEKEMNDGAVSRASLTIPVVFHVIYNSNAEYLPLQQLQDAITILNQDYNRQNNDAQQTGIYGGYDNGCNQLLSYNYGSIAANVGIQFVLADVTYDFTPYAAYDLVNYPLALKQQFPYYQIYPPACYLNVWTCNMSGTLLGLASFPGTPINQDGVSVAYHSLGFYNVNYRVLTHETGHWLGLRHIWGDTQCGDDYVQDTAPQQDNNASMSQNPPFPNYPNQACGTWTACPNNNVQRSCFDGQFYYYPYVNMGDNYMDYSPSSCLNFFSAGQKQRMWSHINTYRSSLYNNSCAINALPSVSPNSLHLKNTGNSVQILDADLPALPLQLYTLTGQLLQQTAANVTELNIEALPQGIYIIRCGERTGKIYR